MFLSLREPLTDAQIQALRARNDERREAAVKALGERYALHPRNHVQRRALRQGGALC